MSNELERGIQIKSDNGIVYLPDTATAEEIRQAVSVQVIDDTKPKEMTVTINQYYDKMTIDHAHYDSLLRTDLQRGKTHTKKPHKPNTGFKLGSYVYKSKRK